MAMKSKSTEQWREYFENGNCSLYQIIFHAIRVAALDYPEEFKLRRKQIVERLYSCKFTGCCNSADQTFLDVQSTLTRVFNDCKKTCANKATKLDAHVNAVGSEVCRGRGTPDHHFDELGHKTGDDRDKIRRVLQIQEELENNDELTETKISESLRKVQLIIQSVDVLEATKIGSTISNLQKHWSRQISLLARNIADQWKAMIVELVNRAAETEERTKKPEPPLVLEEWWEFPSAEFVPQPPVEFTEKFLDDMDDCGYPFEENKVEEMQRNPETENKTEVKKEACTKREKIKQETVEKSINCKYDRPSNKSHEIEKIRGVQRNPVSNRSHEIEKIRGIQRNPVPNRSHETEKLRGAQRNPVSGNRRKLEVQLIEDAELITPINYQKVKARQDSIPQRPNSRPPKTEHTSDRNIKPTAKKEVKNHMEISNNKKDNITGHETPNVNAGLKNASKEWDDDSALEQKLETTKRKLQAGYQAHERAKRNIQIIPELRDLPKQTSGRGRSFSRSNVRKRTRIL